MSFRQGAPILPPPPLPQNEPLKSPPRFGLMYDKEESITVILNWKPVDTDDLGFKFLTANKL